MFKKTLIIVVLLFVSSCSSYRLNNLFGQSKPKQHRNPDMQYLEDENHYPETRKLYREEPPHVQVRHPHHAQEGYYEDDEAPLDSREEDDEDEEDYGDEYVDSPTPRDRCAFYGLTPGTAAHNDCQRQLHKQKYKGGYYR